MVSVPLRAAPLFDATLNATEPPPVPDAPCVIVIHGAFDVALHAQPLVVVTAADPVPPAASTDWLAGEIE
jgi:hypothetical protein